MLLGLVLCSGNETQMDLLFIWVMGGLVLNFVYLVDDPSFHDSWSRLQKVFFHIVTGPVGWLTGIWKLCAIW